MAAANLQGSVANDLKFMSGLKFDFNKKTLGSAEQITLTVDSPTVNIFNADTGGNDVLLPLETAQDAKGIVFIIANNEASSGNLNLKEADDSTAVATIGPLDTAIVICDGAAWHVLSLYAG